jgi:hypothetical protein
MGNRGRVSSASLAVIGPGGVSTVRRPDPPAELSDEEAEEWRAIVNRLSADWFPRETHALLVQFCRSVITCRYNAQLIARVRAHEAFDLRDYDRLLQAQARENGVLATLATKLRICQSATYDKSKKKPLQGQRPWDIKQG